jgi:tetratricopeptide (TPR) repeat protein
MAIWQEFKALTLDKQFAVVVGIVTLIGGGWKAYQYFFDNLAKPQQTVIEIGPKQTIAINGSVVGVAGSAQTILNSINLRDPQDKEIIDALLSVQKGENLRAVAQAQQIQELQKTIQALRAQGDKPEVQDALAALAKGDTGAAEKLFQQVLGRKIAEGRAASQEAAAAARHLGSLAFFHDTQKALQAYKQATELDPGNPSGWIGLGLLFARIGDLDSAKKAYQSALRIGEDTGDQESVAEALGKLGGVYHIRGDLDKAVEMCNKSLKIAKTLGSKEGNPPIFS